MLVLMLLLTATFPNTICQLSDKAIGCAENGELYWTNDDMCYGAATKGPCEEEEWFVLTRAAGEGSCQPRGCHNHKMVDVNGECRWLTDKRVCRGVGERLFTNMYGQGECACTEGFYRHSGGRCYQEFTKGWCSNGQVLLKLHDLVDSTPCRTVNTTIPRRKTNTPCVFPFRYKGKTYDGCTDVDDDDSVAWCSTKVDFTGGHVNLVGEWGYCSQDCPASGFPSLTLEGIVDSREITALLIIDLVKVNNTEKLVCRDNPCGNPDLKLMWYDGKCHDIWESVDKCTAALNEKEDYVEEEGDDYYEEETESLESDDESIGKIGCEVGDSITAFSVGTIRKKKKCKEGAQWSKRLKKCAKNPFLG